MDLLTIKARLRDGMPCIDARGKPCPHRTALAGCDCTIAEQAIDRLMLALTQGLQLAESGGHGKGVTCPTCHFVRHARHALGLVVPDIEAPTEQ